MKWCFLFLALLSLSLSAAFPPEVASKVLFLMHKGECERALAAYLDYSKSVEAQDFELLQRAATVLLEQGMQSADSEIQLLSLFGIGISFNRDLLALLGRGLESKEVRHQLIALSFLERMQDDEADRYIKRALLSPSLIVRLEAAYILAGRGDETIIDHLESLYVKVPEPARPLFAEIAAKCNSQSANRMLRRLLSDPQADVRVAAILAIGESNREALLGQIRTHITGRDFREEEAAAYCLGLLQDRNSQELLSQLAKRQNEMVRLAALMSLKALDIPLNDTDLDKETSLFALPLFDEHIDHLQKLAQSEEFTIALNGAFRLLAKGKLPPLKLLSQLLITDERDLGFMRDFSAGKTLFFWKPIPAASQQLSRYPQLAQETLRFKKELLTNTLLLSDEDFLIVAKLILQEGGQALVLPMMELLIERPNETIQTWLHELQNKAGAPLYRIAAAWGYYKLTEDISSEKKLLDWLGNAQSHPLIRFKKEDEKANQKSYRTTFTLNPDETSELLILVFETLARSKKESAIAALIHAMAYGNAKNRYALAGLLIKAAE